MNTVKTSGINFCSAWFSPRGFANEGNYLYGHESDVYAILGRYIDDVNCCIDVQSGHYTMENAQKNANRLAKRDHRMTPDHEICCIGTQEASDFLNEIYTMERDSRFSEMS